MAKKIPCKVISSVPLGQINAGSQSVRHSNNYQYEIDDMCSNLRHNCNIAPIFNVGTINTFPIGQILDCRA
jgi:hypothetical protein